MPDLSSQRTQIGITIGVILFASAAALLTGEPLVLPVLGLLPLVGIIAFRNPFLMCLGFILFSFFRLHEAFMFMNPLHIPQMLAIGSLSVLCVHLVFKKIEIAWTRELKLFTIFFAIITVGIAGATGRDLALNYWTDTYVKIFIMVFAIASLAREPRDFGIASRAIVMAGMAIAFVAISNSLNGLEQVEGTRVTIGRSTGSALGDPNDLSLVLAFPLSFAVALILTPGTGILSRMLGVSGFLTIAWAVMATQSRGGLLGMVAVCAIFAARRIKSRALLITVGVIGVMGLFAVAGISGRSSGGAAEGGLVDESSEGRLEAWKAAFRMAVAHPFTGVGLNNYVANYYEYSDWWEGFAKAVHSTWFSVLAEGGFIAFGIFITLIVSVFKITTRAVRVCSPQATGSAYQPNAYGMASAVQAGMAGFVVSGTFLTQGFTWPVYILLALTVAIGRYSDRVQAASNSADSRNPADLKSNQDSGSTAT